MEKDYQLIILGGGPAGLSAGIYASRDKLNTLLIEKGMMGGLALYAESLENYPGFPQGISGMELGDAMLKQAEKFGLKTLNAEITGLEIKDGAKIVKTSEGEFTAKALIISLGSDRLHLEVPGETEFLGRGVSYCATCDAAFFRDQEVAIVGGGNSAVNEAMHLAKFASKVYIIHRRHELRATPAFVDKAKADPKISFVLGKIVQSIDGSMNVEKLSLVDAETKVPSTLPVSGIFVAVGQRPNTAFLKGIVNLDERGYIITNEKMETSVPGVFAAGDIRTNSIRQTISAAGDGSVAAVYADHYIGK